MSAALALKSEPAPVIIRRARAEDARAVNVYIDQSTDGTIFHRPGWGEAAQAAYGYDNATLIAEREGGVVGVLPLLDVRAPLLGRSLISAGFCIGGGPIGDDDSVVAALAEEAARLGAATRAAYVELRSNPSGLTDEWREKTGVHASFELALPAGEEETLAMIPRKRRAEIRKAIKAAEAGELSLRMMQDTDEFYSLYAAALRDHGTPVFPRRFLDALVDAFRDDVEISIVEWRGESVAALLSFYDKHRVRPYYIGATPNARPARAAEYLYWMQMRRAAEKGCTEFDFGRSKVDTGPYHFKKLWGAEPQMLTYRCRLFGATEMPDVNPNNPKFAAFISLWRRLPTPLANRLGPLIAGNFP